MTCKECEEVLLDSENRAGRKSWMASVSLLNLARQHAESCSACSAQMAEIARMEATLDQWRRLTIQIEVPASIESNLLQEFRNRRTMSAPLVPRAFRWRLVWGSAAALALVAGFIVYAALRARPSLTAQAARNGHSVEQLPSGLPSGAGSDQLLIDNHRPRADRAGLLSAKTERATKQSKLPETQAQGRSMSPLGNELSLNGGGNVVRVTLPVASLVAMGVPMDPELSDRRVTADVARDPFGAVIGIRLVETKPSAN
jgi:hypothetical protein